MKNIKKGDRFTDRFGNLFIFMKVTCIGLYIFKNQNGTVHGFNASELRYLDRI